MKKIKIAGIILAGLAILVAAFLTVRNTITKNKYPAGRNTEHEENAGLYAPESFPVGNSLKSALPERDYAGSSDESAAPSEPIATDKKIIKTGSLNLQVDNVDKAAEKISEIAKNNSGEVFSSSIVQRKDNIKSGNITVKVPFANFEKTIGEIKKIASLVVSENTFGQDITEEYADLQARIKNKQAEEQSYIKILDQAQKISDILEITRQLSIVRGEIERMEGRIKLMNSQTEMSTISISLSEDQDITMENSWRPFQIIKNAVNSLVKMSQGFISFLIVLIITVIPVAILYLLLAFVIYLIGRKIWQKIKNRKENNLP